MDAAIVLLFLLIIPTKCGNLDSPHDLHCRVPTSILYAFNGLECVGTFAPLGGTPPSRAFLPGMG